MSKNKKPKILLKETFLSMVENSVGAKIFRNLYVSLRSSARQHPVLRIPNTGCWRASKLDILGNGRLSCAVFVSGVLYLNKLIGDVHATVDGTENDLKKSGWQKTKNLSDLRSRTGWGLRRGDVLVWEPWKWPASAENSGEAKPGDKELHKHIGFYMGNDEAISNDYKTGTPQKHHLTFGTLRQAQGKSKTAKPFGPAQDKPVRKIISVYGHPKLK